MVERVQYASVGERRVGERSLKDATRHSEDHQMAWILFIRAAVQVLVTSGYYLRIA